MSCTEFKRIKLNLSCEVNNIDKVYQPGEHLSLWIPKKDPFVSLSSFLVLLVFVLLLPFSFVSFFVLLVLMYTCTYINAT